MDKAKILETIASLNLIEKGVYSTRLADMLTEKESPEAVVAALNNSDTEGVLLQVLEEDPESIVNGLSLAMEASGASKKILVLPQNEAGDHAYTIVKDLAFTNHIEIERGPVDKRKHDQDVLLHILTVKELYEAMDGKKNEGTYVSVNGKPVQKVASDTRLEQLLGTEIKAILAGYVLLPKSALKKTIAEIPLENGILKGLTEKECVIKTVEEQLLKCRKQSCGKCVFCREGLIQLEEMHKDITLKKGSKEAPALIHEIGEAMIYSTSCSMGQKAALLPLSALNNFADEYEQHIKKKRCPSAGCDAYVSWYIDPRLCSGCHVCSKICKTHAIDGREGYIHVIDEFDCTKCGECMSVCKSQAIKTTAGRVPKLPDRMTKVGKFRKW